MTNRGDWDPFNDLMHVQKRMNQLFETALARTDFDTPEGLDSWTPVSDVYETGGNLVVCLELPGLEQDQIELRIEEDELVVEGERKLEREAEGEQFHRVERSYGKFSRRFRLPSTVKRDAIQATFKNGLLHVTLPRVEDTRPRSVRVAIN